MMKMLHIHPNDNVAVALADIGKGEAVELNGVTVTAAEDIGRGHKMALRDLAEGEKIVKYGYPIGHASCAVKAGEWVHVHNARPTFPKKATTFITPILSRSRRLSLLRLWVSAAPTGAPLSATNYGLSRRLAVSTRLPSGWCARTSTL